jgi:hypothetical protein
MKKLQIALIVIFVFLLVFVSFSISQSQDIKKLKAGMPNTVTLSNGEVVYDLNGEWNSFVEPYGPWSEYNALQNIIKITQTGSSLVGILMMDDKWYLKGYESIRAELDKSGFKEVEMLTNGGILDSKGQISDDGNKIIIDDGEKRRMTLTRK